MFTVGLWFTRLVSDLFKLLQIVCLLTILISELQIAVWISDYTLKLYLDFLKQFFELR